MELEMTKAVVGIPEVLREDFCERSTGGCFFACFEMDVWACMFACHQISGCFLFSSNVSRGAKPTLYLLTLGVAAARPKENLRLRSVYRKKLGQRANGEWEERFMVKIPSNSRRFHRVIETLMQNLGLEKDPFGSLRSAQDDIRWFWRWRIYDSVEIIRRSPPSGGSYGDFCCFWWKV